MSEKQFALLRSAVTMYERMCGNSPHDRELRLELAEAITRYAEVLPDAVAFDETIARADQIIDGFLADDPDERSGSAVRVRLHRLKGFRLAENGYQEQASSEYASSERERCRTPSRDNGYFVTISRTNQVEVYSSGARILAGLGRYDEAIRMLSDANELIDSSIAQQPQVLRFYDFQELARWELGLVTFLKGDVDLATRHFRESFSVRRPDGVVGAAWDPRKMRFAFRLAACPLPELRDPQVAMAIVDRAMDTRTTNPRWWTTKALCHIRREEWQQAEQALQRADRHWRSPHPLGQVVRLLLAQERHRAGGGPPPQASDLAELANAPTMPLEAELLRRELRD